MSCWQKLQEGAAADYSAFLRALKSPRSVQLGQLRNILSANEDCEVGKRYGFDRIKDAGEYRQRVPIQTYADLAPSISRMASGDSGVICSAPVRVYEETGGSCGGAKVIPFTDRSMAAFRRALLPWIADLIRSRPALTAGRAYWALSPVARELRTTLDGTPIGLCDEAEFLGPELAPEFAALSVVPAILSNVVDVQAWRDLTLRYLLAAEDLALISIWSPTFLLPLLDALAAQREHLAEEIANGGTLEVHCRNEVLSFRFDPNPERAKTINRALAGATPDTTLLWPRLDTISCWTDGGSQRFASRLRELFPHAYLQGKGLLATEGAVTIPIVGAPFPVLTILSGFYEFIDSQGDSRLCDELAVGQTYRVLMTTYGGLYRYDLGDSVRVRGWLEQTPMLEFVGRTGLVSDLCGEKLTDDFVAARLTHIPAFCMLAPVMTPSPHYVLFLDRDEYDETEARDLASRLDFALKDNPQYLYARRLEQLGPVRSQLVSKPLQRYVRSGLKRGQRLGDIKPPVLRAETDWEKRFAAS